MKNGLIALKLRHVIWFLTIQTVLGSTALAVCQIPSANMSSEANNRNRIACLAQARFLDPVPDASSPDFNTQLISPRVKDGIDLRNGNDIHCRFHYQRQNGNSAKFRCALTNAQNQLFDSRGNLVPEAVRLVTENDDVYLADARGTKLQDRKALILKIRYSDGNKRNRENYASTTASRILWAIGVPAHTNIMSNQILCFGCDRNPFDGQRAPIVDRRNNYTLTAFRHASIEIKYEGKRMYDPTERPWSWSEVNQLLGQNVLSQDRRIESEVFTLANHFLGYTSDASAQNALVCTQRDPANPAICRDSVAFVHDIGSSFGNRYKKSFLSDRPRGDLDTYAQARIFRENSCEFMYSSSRGDLPRNISRAAQQEFLERARNLTPQTLQTIISASRIGYIDARDEQQAREREARWVQAINAKLQEIQSANCP